MRFQNVVHRSTLSAIARDAIVDKDIGGIGAAYDAFVAEHPETEKALLAGYGRAQIKTARAHHLLAGRILSQLFEQTSDAQINHVKAEVFGIEGGAPITHPTLTAMLSIVPKGALGPFVRAQNDPDSLAWQARTRASKLC